jgi:hypothetical protein
MAETELKQTITTEGASESERDINAVAAAEERLVDAQKRLGAARAGGNTAAIEKEADAVARLEDELGTLAPAYTQANEKTGDLNSLLSQISPTLGAFATSLSAATTLAGQLAEKELKLADIKGFLTGATKKYAGALTLLGAGGAAFIAVNALIGAFRKMNEELKEAIENRKALDKANQSAVDKGKQFGERITQAVESGAIPVPDDGRIKELEKKFRELQRSGVSPGAAFEIAIGRRGISKDQLEFLDQQRGVRARGEAAREQLGPDLSGTASTESIKFIADRMNTTVEEVARLIEIQRKFVDEGGDLSGETKTAGDRAMETLRRSSQFSQQALAVIIDFIKKPSTLDSKQLEELNAILRAFRTDEERRSRSLDRAAESMQRAAENLETVTDRAAQRRIRMNGGIVREGAVAGR